ncbi:hypothetical protein MNBD_GAMMA25-43 [hydrothermal vent metagenome]|uniref:Methyltransferase FkbM domain-containing protein n=1 Tax=hydrothermal vent metagenome TaxID=652676 RepID=A0A3B1AW50_9ZZZZ
MKKFDQSTLANIDFKPGKLKRLLRKIKWLFTVYLPARHDATVLTRNGLLTFDSKDKTTGRILHIYRNHEFDDMMEIVEFLRVKGVLSKNCAGTVIDVGGYIGMSSTAFLLEKVFKQSLAFEPSPVNYKLLQKNIENNGLSDSLRAFNIALSDSNGELSFELSEKNYGDHRVRNNINIDKGHFGEDGREVIKVAARKFDDFLIEHEEIEQSDIRLIWMDIQGHEMKFISGARQFLLKHPQIPVMMEFWPYAILRSGVTKMEFSEVLGSIFNKFYSFGNEGFIEYNIADIGGYFDANTDPEGGTAIMLTN